MLQEYIISNSGKQVVRDKEQEAINAIKNMEDVALSKHPDGYYVCDSGGKDSLVLCDLFLRAEVKCDFHHNFTTCDHPITNKYVRARKVEIEALGYSYEIHFPTYKGEPTSIFKLIPLKGLPTRIRRWCCEVFKEHGGIGRVIATGVRWAESRKRKARAQFETITPKIKDRVFLNNDNEFRRTLEICPTYDKLALNPIISWTDEEVWEYIRKYNLAYNPLYNMGYKRVGCVGCPMSTKAKQELGANPKFYNAYYKACEKYLETRHNHYFKTAKEMMDWWLGRKPRKDENQIEMEFDAEDE